jgi:molecular chaperone GrpE (heat shock protein)
VLDRDQLMSLLRSQAVLRRQLQNLALDRLRVEEQHALLQGQWKTLQDQRQQLLRKQARYEAFGQRLNRERQMVLQRRDNNENEELLHIRNRQPVHEA